MAEVLALVDQASAIVYRGIADERTVVGLPDDERQLLLVAGDGTWGPAALQTACEQTLTCTATVAMAGFGTHLA